MSVAIKVEQEDLKQGLLGLVMALVEIVRDTLKVQALKRMEHGSLTEDECERLGETLMRLDAAIEQIKYEQGITDCVQAVRDSLDDLVTDTVDRLIDPEAWREELEQISV